MTEEKTDTYEDFDFSAFQRQVITEFRENKGKVGGMLAGATLALLTTIGARSGQRRTSPLAYLEIDGQPLVIASAMGAPNNPAWYHNIRHNPMVTVETGTETYEAIAAVPAGEERDKLFAKVTEEAPGFADYQAKTARVIPVVTLHRVEPLPGDDRVRGLGDFIMEVHGWLRQELVQLRRKVDEILDGRADSVTIDRTPTSLTQEMRTHCLIFCGTLNKHHTGEDMSLFPMLAQRFPALAPALTKLAEEHTAVARLQEEIRQLVAGYVPGESDPIRLRDELKRLASELEVHFTYEEQTVVRALNAMCPPEIG